MIPVSAASVLKSSGICNSAMTAGSRGRLLEGLDSGKARERKHEQLMDTSRQPRIQWGRGLLLYSGLLCPQRLDGDDHDGELL